MAAADHKTNQRSHVESHDYSTAHRTAHIRRNAIISVLNFKLLVSSVSFCGTRNGCTSGLCSWFRVETASIHFSLIHTTMG
jgi:hypothetical protein